MTANELRLFTSAKQFRSSFEYEGSTFEIEVETPDLSGATQTVWGDWGPMYTFEFDTPRAVRVTYRCDALSIEEEIEIEVPKMQLESPMQYAQRLEHPLFLRFRDQARGLEFEGHLDAWGRPASLDVRQVALGADVVSLLLWQPPQSRGWSQSAGDRKVA